MNDIEVRLADGRTVALTESEAEEVCEALCRNRLEGELEYRLWGKDNGTVVFEPPYDERSAEVAKLVEQGLVDPADIVESALAILWDTDWETSLGAAFDMALEEACDHPPTGRAEKRLAGSGRGTA
ncbi:hypothetical protein [Caniella muris]|uniref:hypothetical protein n=1 Tax=Caniella muris TaxID=2941502 RepID=UPI00203EDDF4|nr:hypothetical protein [Caniella muris]